MVLVFDDPDTCHVRSVMRMGEYRWRQTLGPVHGIVALLVAHKAFGSKVVLKLSVLPQRPQRQTEKRGIVMSMVKHKRGNASALSAHSMRLN